MQYDQEAEQYILCPDRTVLKCSCGEKLILLGREEDWYSEGRTTFECHKCGATISLANLLDEGRGPALIGDTNEEAMSVRDLIRSLRAAGQ